MVDDSFPKEEAQKLMLFGLLHLYWGENLICLLRWEFDLFTDTFLN